MRPPPCTDADDLLRCSATVGNVGERGGPDILIHDLLRAKDRSKHMGPPF